ncbi:MAG: peptide chain release factor 1 [bacterium]
MHKTPEEIIVDYNSNNTLLSSPEIFSNNKLFTEISIAQDKLTKVYQLALDILNLKKNITQAKELLMVEKDSDMTEYLNNSITSDETLLSDLIESFSYQLSEDAVHDSRNAILEIRAGTGGDEAALFAQDLYRMYLKYAEQKNWKIEQLSLHETGNHGIKEVIVLISGKGIYGSLKYEGGVHRVQRIPLTESAGRIHTSAASVVVLPEVDDVEVNIDPEDIRIDVFRAGGPGGQSVNTTDSAVRITHIPSNIVVSCQDQKSQLKNKAQAMKVLKSRLFEMEFQKQQAAISAQRKNSIGSGDRSAKIRTYNFAQSRITDHRIKKSWYNLLEVLDGNLEEIINTTRKQLILQQP